MLGGLGNHLHCKQQRIQSLVLIVFIITNELMTLDFYSLIQGLHQTISLGVIDLVCSNLYSSLMDDINDMSYSVKISYSILMWEIPKTVPVSHLLHFCRDVAKAYCFCISCCVAHQPYVPSPHLLFR